MAVKCEICGFEAHYLNDHLSEVHSMTEATYQVAYPNAPTMSVELKDRWEKQLDRKSVV